MADTGWVFAGTGATLLDGDGEWADPGAITADDFNYAYNDEGLFSQPANDDIVRLTLSGSPMGNNKATFTEIPEVMADVSYGGAADGWGASLLLGNVQNSTFGVIFQYEEGGGRVDTLRATNFDFSGIPAGSTCDGVEVRIHVGWDGADDTHIYADYVQMKVHYTEPASSGASTLALSGVG